MEANARAGIDIYGNVLRYAEVEQYGTRYRLLRLGSCDFDFDVADAVWQADQSGHLSTVAEALADVFAGSAADQFQVTVHPPTCFSFFTPVPAGISDAARKVRLQQEAALLAGTDIPLRLTADALYSAYVGDPAERVDWVHVLAVPERIHTRFDRILRSLPQARHRLMVSMQAAAATVGRLLPLHANGGTADAEAPYTLAVGGYGGHVEFTLCHRQRWHFSHFTDTGPAADLAYYAVALLQRLHLHPADVGTLYVYGHPQDTGLADLLERVFHRRPAALNPLEVVDLDAGSLTADFDAEAYVSCMGAAL
jgi:hypothetical protein